MSRSVVALLLHAADARARVVDGVGKEHLVREHSDLNALLATMDGGAVVLVVIDVLDAMGRSLAPAVVSIRRSFPTIPILAYSALSAATSNAVLDVARAGATGLVFRGVDDVGHAMRAAIRSARQGSVTRRVYDKVSSHIAPSVHPFLRYAISRAADDPSVDDAAQSLGVDRKTLFNWLRPTGIAPREFIGWVRLSIAIGLLEDPRRTAEQVALELGFPSGTAFRNMFHRYAHMKCSMLRGPDGLDRMLALLTTRLLGPEAPAPATFTSGDHAAVIPRPA